MNTYKRNVFGLFFLSYFAVYAVSPIIYTLSPGKTSEFIARKAHVSSFTDGFQVFLLETVWEEVVPGEEEQSGSDAVKFLVKKKRAVLPENRLAKTPHADASLVEEVRSFSPAPQVGRISDPGTPPGGRDHRPLYLCHSPPAMQLLLA